MPLFSDSNWKFIHEEYMNGLTMDQLALKYECARRTIGKNFKRLNLKCYKNGQHMIENQRYDKVHIEPTYHKIQPYINEYGDIISSFREKSNGYLIIVCNGKKIYYHQYIWLKYNNNYLKIPKGFNIHHINKNIKDNRIENLELLSISEHRKKHIKKEVEENVTIPK